ncbi:glycosyltransferase family 77 protein [Gammaproteobacteria bacterium]|nr:glycosyltransferase family 77 protein [Gammaproteobacteria bacterium]
MKPGNVIADSGNYELHQRVSSSTLALSPLPNISGRGIQMAPVQTAEQKLDLVNGDIPEHRLAQAESFHQAYRSQSGERMEALQSLYQELGEPQNLVITLFCRKYFPLFKNWLISCDRNELNPRDNTIAFCLDNESAQRATALGIKNCFLDPEIYAPAGGAGRFADESFRATMLYKNAIISDALELGASILFQDADLIWLKDPFSHLNSHGQYYDVQIMYDGPNRRYRPIYCNSGFIYVRPNDTTKALFETALRNSACILKSGGHQFALVRILDYFLDHQLLRLHVLPEHLFMNGHLFNRNGGIRPSAKNWREHGIVFHYSWSLNIQEKFEKIGPIRYVLSGLQGYPPCEFIQ